MFIVIKNTDFVDVTFYCISHACFEDVMSSMQGGSV